LRLDFDLEQLFIVFLPYTLINIAANTIIYLQRNKIKVYIAIINKQIVEEKKCWSRSLFFGKPSAPQQQPLYLFGKLVALLRQPLHLFGKLVAVLRRPCYLFGKPLQHCDKLSDERESTLQHFDKLFLNCFTISIFIFIFGTS
jgi:hypothetical protein